jgi:hypothetical protein
LRGKRERVLHYTVHARGKNSSPFQNDPDFSIKGGKQWDVLPDLPDRRALTIELVY